MLQNNEIVYHYCSIDSFKSIIEHNCIRLCDVQKSNDSDERTFFENIMKSTIEYFINHPIALTSMSLKPNMYYVPLALRTVAEILSGSSSIRAPIYACSFSMIDDQLSQWRGYADDGYGLSIGFSQHLCREHFRNHFGAVHYNYEQAVKASKLIIRNSLVACSQHEQEETFKANFILDILRKMEAIGIFYKSNAFSEEKERRIVMQIDDSIFAATDNSQKYTISRSNNWTDNLSPFTISKRCYRISDKRLSSYYELNFEKIKNEFICEIILGPKCRTAEDDLKMFLSDFGYNVSKIRIRQSTATYR